MIGDPVEALAKEAAYLEKLLNASKQGRQLLAGGSPEQIKAELRNLYRRISRLKYRQWLSQFRSGKKKKKPNPLGVAFKLGGSIVIALMTGAVISAIDSFFDDLTRLVIECHLERQQRRNIEPPPPPKL